MKKIMFNDRYGLTTAVLEGRKTMTRRIVPDGTPLGNWEETEKMSRFKVGEVVAVAQKYSEIYDRNFAFDFGIVDEPGWKNKMFVSASEMPHQIRITSVRIERIQDISDEDCLREGIFWDYGDYPYMATKMYKYNEKEEYLHPKAAFAALIDRVAGKWTWLRNPWVFVYEFELVEDEK